MARERRSSSRSRLVTRLTGHGIDSSRSSPRIGGSFRNRTAARALHVGAQLFRLVIGPVPGEPLRPSHGQLSPTSMAPLLDGAPSYLPAPPTIPTPAAACIEITVQCDWILHSAVPGHARNARRRLHAKPGVDIRRAHRVRPALRLRPRPARVGSRAGAHRARARMGRRARDQRRSARAGLRLAGGRGARRAPVSRARRPPCRAHPLRARQPRSPPRAARRRPGRAAPTRAVPDRRGGDRLRARQRPARPGRLWRHARAARRRDDAGRPPSPVQLRLVGLGPRRARHGADGRRRAATRRPRACRVLASARRRPARASAVPHR